MTPYATTLDEVQALRSEVQTVTNTARINLKVAQDSLADVRRLRAGLRKAILHMENGEDHNEGAFDESCDTCVLLKELV